MRIVYFLSISVFLFFSLHSSNAFAQEEEVPNRSAGTAIVGMGLLGGELALSIGSVAGLRKPVLVIVSGGVGFAGGLVGGILFQRGIANPTARDIGGTSSLILGMAGVIPTILILLQTRANDISRPFKDEAPDEISLLPPALLRVSEGQFSLGAPSIIPLKGQKGELPIGTLLFSGKF